MYLRNLSRYPDAEVEALVQLAAEPYDLRRVAVLIKNTQYPYRGLAYCSAPRRLKGVHAKATRAVMVAVGPPSKFTQPVSNLRTTYRWVRITHEEYERLPPGIPTRGCGNADETWMEKSVATVTPYGGAKAPLIHFHDWREALLGVAAHEFHHIQQYQRGVVARERYCEQAAAAALERYRAQKRPGVCEGSRLRERTSNVLDDLTGCA